LNLPKAVTIDDLRTIARGLPDVEETTTHGSLAFKSRGKLFAWMPVKKSVEAGTLAIRIEFDRRADLIAEAPEIYYLIDHYKDYPAVLVRLSRIDTDALRDLLRGAWQFVNATTKVKRTIRKKDSTPAD
jgi:hypothetical protein